MSRVLVIYASTHGNTAKIAGKVAAILRTDGVQADLRNVEEEGGLDPTAFDGVNVSASLHRGHHQPGMADWVTAHSAELDGRESAFLSVSLTAAEDDDEAREATQRCIDEFVEDTGWTPGEALKVAGALQYGADTAAGRWPGSGVDSRARGGTPAGSEELIYAKTDGCAAARAAIGLN